MSKIRLLIWIGVFALLTFGGWFMITMPGTSYSGPLPSLTRTETQIRNNLHAHVDMLANTIGERNIWHIKQLDDAADYIKNTFEKFGYRVSEQPYDSHGKTVKNIIAEKRGTKTPDEIVIIGAHYDSVFGSPGANDNATGVAAVLEIARLLKDKSFPRTVRFIAFTNEEPPLFLRDDMGSRQYAARAKKQNENIVGMLSIETIGYYDDTKGSQKYPFGFGLFYPNTANFIAFVSNLASQSLVRDVIGRFRQETSFPSEGLAAPSWIVGVGWSDQWSFWEQGYPAMMVTDTALFRYPYYHTEEDTSDKVNYDRAARVIKGLSDVTNYLGSR